MPSQIPGLLADGADNDRSKKENRTGDTLLHYVIEIGIQSLNGMDFWIEGRSHPNIIPTM